MRRTSFGIELIGAETSGRVLPSRRHDPSDRRRVTAKICETVSDVHVSLRARINGRRSRREERSAPVPDKEVVVNQYVRSLLRLFVSLLELRDGFDARIFGVDVSAEGEHGVIGRHESNGNIGDPVQYAHFLRASSLSKTHSTGSCPSFAPLPSSSTCFTQTSIPLSSLSSPSFLKSSSFNTRE